jgi:subfamily B ATP-binding cassette protein HlyB/CyaB
MESFHSAEPAESAAEPVTHSLVKALRTVQDFASLDDRTLLKIVGTSTNLFWPAGSVIFDPGSPSDALFVILSGSVRIHEEEDGREIEVSRLASGSSFGEISLLLRTTHTKVARATQDTELMVIPKESFEELLATNPDLAALFRQRLEERLTVRGDVSEGESA